MWNTIWSGYLEPVVVSVAVTLLIAGIGILGNVTKGYLEKAKEYVVAKIGIEAYNSAYTFARNLYYALEKEYASQLKSGEAKKAEMLLRLQAQFPSLTNTQLDAINEAVCAEINQLEISAGLVDKTTTETTIVSKVVDDKVVDKKTTVVATSTSTVTDATLDVASVKVETPAAATVDMVNQAAPVTQIVTPAAGTTESAK